MLGLAAEKLPSRALSDGAFTKPARADGVAAGQLWQLDVARAAGASVLFALIAAASFAVVLVALRWIDATLPSRQPPAVAAENPDSRVLSGGSAHDVRFRIR